MEDVRKIVYEDNRSDAGMMAMMTGMLNKQGIDPSVLAMMGGQNGGFGGQNGMFMMLFLLLLLGRNGLNGLGGGGEALNTVQNNELLMNAINGNNAAIRDLAGLTNTSITAVNGALANLNTQLATIGGQIGLSSQQVINSIQMGNSTLSSQLAACCCDVRTAILTQGAENRFAELNQTIQLNENANRNHQETMARFNALELREVNRELTASNRRETELAGELSNVRQTQAVCSMIQPLAAEVAAIRCHQLPTYPQQYVPGAPVGGGAVAFGYGYGGYPFGFPGGCGCHGHHHHHGGSSAAAPTNP